MSKELEALERGILEFEKELEYDCNNEWLKRVIAGMKKCYQRLEAIDNANDNSEPSEALEKLEECAYAMKDLPMSNWCDLANSEAELDEKIFTWVEEIKFELFKGKQALLKQQETKKTYLKWEDLEFGYGTKTQKVRMNENIYKIAYRCDGIKEVQLLSEDEKLLYISFVGKYKDNVQLFNNLHLERVEE